MRFRDGLKRSFVSGMLLVAPLVLTIVVLRVLADWALLFIDPIVEGTRLTNYTANVEVAAQALAFVLIVASIIVLGYLAQKSIGRELFGRVGRVVNVIPLVSTIYGSVRQVADSLVERNTAYESVVLVEYPREGVYSIGLVTGESPQSVEAFAGGEVYNVFLPNSPNPTAGRLVLLPEDQVHEIDMSVRAGMRLVVTTGAGVEDAPPSIDPARLPNVGSAHD
jgi:uncharacterized membrane protein